MDALHHKDNKVPVAKNCVPQELISFREKVISKRQKTTHFRKQPEFLWKVIKMFINPVDLMPVVRPDLIWIVPAHRSANRGGVNIRYMPIIHPSPL